MKLLNPDLSQTSVAAHQNGAGLALATQLAVMAVIVEFRTHATDKCAFVAYLLVPDDYGQQQKIPLFAFGFDRALYNKINWANFDNTKLSKDVMRQQELIEAIDRSIADEKRMLGTGAA